MLGIECVFSCMVEVLVAVGNTSGKYDGLALSICHLMVCTMFPLRNALLHNARR